MPRKIVLVLLLMLSAQQAAFGAELNFVEQLSEGGIAVLVIVALSILFVAVTLERLIHLRTKAIAPKGLIERIQPLWASHDFSGLQTLLEKEDSTLARIID